MPSLDHRAAPALALRCGLLLLALSASGCVTRTVEDKVVFEEGITITLRGQVRRGKPLDRGFQHPATISTQRLSHILGAIEIRDERSKNNRQQMGAFGNEVIEPLAKQLSKAFGLADSSQELAVQVVRKQSRLKLFNEKYLTSFVTYAQGDSLYFHLSRIEWEIPKKRGDRDKGTLPEPRIGDDVMDFSTLNTRGVYKVSKQAAAVKWRDPLFAKPLPIRGSGRHRTRTIIEQSPIPIEDRPSYETDGLSPDDLRALADLEEARAAGKITESEYLRRRAELIGR